MFKKRFVEITSMLFIVLFVYAATSKLVDVEKFRVQLGQSPMLVNYADVVAWSVPALEYLIAVFLMFETTRLWALWASFSLMVAFTTYIIAITQFSTYIPCSCGGVLQDMTWNQHLLFNVAFVLAGGAAVLLFPNNKMLSPRLLSQDLSGLEATF